MGDVEGISLRERGISLHARGGGIVEGTVILGHCLKRGEVDFMEDMDNIFLNIKNEKELIIKNEFNLFPFSLLKRKNNNVIKYLNTFEGVLHKQIIFRKTRHIKF